MKHVTGLLWLLLLIACAPTPPTESGKAASTGEYDFSGVHLRLRNHSGQDFTDVALIVDSQSEQIGSLSWNETTDYLTFTAVQHPPTIHVTIEETMYEWTAVPATAESLIAGGQFTLELVIENDALTALFLMENPILQDAQTYADAMGVTLEEALARLDSQNEDAISALQNQLQVNEADTFAGLWLQHEPEYRVVVAFTHDGEETIQKYAAEDSELAQKIEVRPAQYTYAQLEADQQEAFRILNALHLPAAGGIMVMENRVVLDITDRAAFEEALAAANASLPESVVVNTLYEPVGETPPFAITSVPDVFMPQLKQRDVVFMDALLIGELVVEDGCLRVQDSYTEEHTLVIWQADYYLTDNAGILEILDEAGTVRARVGEIVYMGGGEQRAVDDAELRQPIPDECGGPYWRMGEFLPEEYIPNVSADLPATTQSYDGEAMGIAFDYPAGWLVHEAGKALQITPNAQPTWSSFFDPDQPHSGPTFDLLHNLNRQMGETPLAEVETLLSGYGSEVAAIEPTASLAHRPDIVVGVYRFTAAEDGMVLLVGAAPNPIPDSPQPVVALTAVVKQDELEAMRPIFEGILRSLRPAVTGQDRTTHSATGVVSDLDSWTQYENPSLHLALRYPPDWTVAEHEIYITLTAPQTVTIDSEVIPWSIWVSVFEKFAENASLYEVIVNKYHFEGVINRFEETLTAETINDQTVYRSTILPALGGQMSYFFDDGDRFVEVALRPFDAERPHDNQGTFAQMFTRLLETVEFTEMSTEEDERE